MILQLDSGGNMKVNLFLTLMIITMLYLITTDIGCTNNIKEYNETLAQEYVNRLNVEGVYFKDKFGGCYVGKNLGARDSFLASVPCDKVGL